MRSLILDIGDIFSMILLVIVNDGSKNIGRGRKEKRKNSKPEIGFLPREVREELFIMSVSYSYSRGKKLGLILVFQQILD